MGELGDLGPQGSVIFGVFVGLVSTSVQSLGLTLQRKSHILEDEKDVSEVQRPPYKRRRWQLGMLMFVVANIVGSTIQITTLPLPVLSTLQASGLVFNSICATLILGEPFTRWSLSGTLLVSGGAVLIAIYGAIGEPAHNLDQLLALLERPQFIWWMISQAFIVVAILTGIRGLKYIYPRNSNTPRLRLLRGMAYGCVSGILSAHSLLVAKSAVELCVRTIVDGKNQFNRWQSYIILLSLIALALIQLYYLHRGLKLCSTSILYPFVFCIYNIIAILDGLIYFHQTDRLSLLSALLITLGTIILLSGVVCLSWRLSNDPSTIRNSIAIPQTPLTPGMGFVDDSSDFEPDHLPQPSSLTSDEESSLPQFPSEISPRLRSNGTPSPSRLRRNVVSEANEIWSELQDSTPAPLASPFSARRSSARSSPFRARIASADETTGLLARANTMGAGTMGRSYRISRKRGMSMPGGSGDGRGREGGGGGGGGGGRGGSSGERRRSSQQDALGGWWKMRWWRDGNGKGKGKRKDGDEDGEEHGTREGV